MYIYIYSNSITIICSTYMVLSTLLHFVNQQYICYSEFHATERKILRRSMYVNIFIQGYIREY